MSKDSIKTTIVVATHKKYKFPNDDIYLPLHVGAEGKESLGYIGDNTGDNISTKNKTFCELTGLYWIYKNYECDYIGLMHYRRYFKSKVRNSENPIDNVLSKEEVTELLNKYDIILPIKSEVVQKSVGKAYEKMHHIKDLDNVKKIITEKYPSYLEAYNCVMEGKKLCLCNMFIMDKKNFDEYCSWLFDILFSLEEITDISNYSSYQKRIFGFLGERLFNVWLEKNNTLKKCYVPVLETEPMGKKDFYKMYFKNIFGIKD